MVDVKISALTDGSPITTSDQIPSARSGANVRVTPSAIGAALFNAPNEATARGIIDAGPEAITIVSTSNTSTLTTTDLDTFHLWTVGSGGNLTKTLPSAASCTGRRITIQKVDVGTSTGIVSSGSVDVEWLVTQNDIVTVTSDGTNWRITYKQIASRRTIWNSSGTYNKPPSLKSIRLDGIGAGGGGGSGRRGAAASIRCGGAGASAGAYSSMELPASLISATETITIGAPGVGGVAATADSANGNNGTDGGATIFGAIYRARGGSAGTAGTTSATSAGGSVAGGTSSSVAGVTAATGSNAAAPQIVGFAGGSGGSGGGMDASNARRNPSGGGSSDGLTSRVVGASSGGASDGIAGTNGTAGPAGNPSGGSGASGGGYGDAVAGGAGGIGGDPGGGGGGGGASLNGQASGAGGDGGVGRLIVLEIF